MSGLYFRYTKEIQNTTKQKESLSSLIENATRLQSDSIMGYTNKVISASVIHHNKLRSCGISETLGNEYKLFVHGSCWLDTSSEKLASPDEILLYLLENGFAEKSSLKGYYTFIFCDLLKNRIIIENDLFGVYPLYFSDPRYGELLVSSEIKSFGTFLNSRKLNMNAVAEMLYFGYLITDETLIEGINRVLPHSRIIYENEKIIKVKLQKPIFSRDTMVTKDMFLNLTDSFEHTIYRYKIDNPEISISLSGGLDSRIAALAAKKMGLKVNSICMGMPKSLECKVASKFAAHNDIPFFSHFYDGKRFSNWFEKAVWVTEGRCHPGHMHYLDGMLTGNYRSEPQLHGLIGDAVIGGDFDLSTIDANNKTEILRQCILSMGSFIYWPSDSARNIFSEKLFLLFRDLKDRISKELFERINFSNNYSDYLWFRYNYRVFGFTIPCLCSQIIPWTDPILPYLDTSFFETCASIERNMILDRQTQIEWALKYYPGIDCVPRLKDGFMVPIEKGNPNAYDIGLKRFKRKNHIKYIICRLSSGRINLKRSDLYYDQWFRNYPFIRKYFKNILFSGDTLSRGLWQEDGLATLINDLRIGRNVWNALSTILLIEIFIRQFIDNFEQPKSILEKSIFLE